MSESPSLLPPGTAAMLPPSRRTFLGASLAALTSTPLLRAEALGDAAPPKTSDDPAFQPSTLFLTWQRDPTTTMTVQWVGAVGETPDTRIAFAPLNAVKAADLPVKADKPGDAPRKADNAGGWDTREAAARPYPQSDLKVFRAELTGLIPGADYQFRIGKRSPTYRFRTMPAKATDTIHFVSGGDCGVNAHATANNAVAARQDPMFAVLGGDLGYDDGRSIEVSLAFLRNYSKGMVGRDGRLIPLVACIGNHEVDGGYNKPRAKAPFFYALFDGLYSETSYATLDFGDYLSLVLLDTNHTSPIEGDQTDWLEKTLKARVDHPNVFVVNHVPAYPSFRKAEGTDGKAGAGEGNRKHWTPLFDRYRVPVVLEHHDHTFKRTKPLLDGRADDNGVIYLGDGSWGRLRAPQPPEKLAYLAASSRDYHLSLHRIQGEERFHVQMDENGRVMDVARSGQRRAVAAGGGIDALTTPG